MAKRSAEVEVTVKADELDEAVEAARETLSELRSELKEARKVLKQIKAERIEVESMVRRNVREEIDEAVKQGLEEFAATTRQAMDNSVAKVSREFDKLAHTFMTGDKRGRPKDGFDLRDLIGEDDG